MAEQENQRSTPFLSGWIAILLSLTALVAAGYTVYLWRESTEDLATVNKDIEALSQRLNQNDSAGRAAEVTFTQLRRTQDENLEQLRTHLDSVLQQLQQDRQTTRDDWLLAEVEYLLRIANQRVLMDKDPASAIALLQAADQILAENIASHSLRAAIAQDLANLQAVETLDVAGIYLSIAAQIRLVDELQRPEYRFSPVLPTMTEDVLVETGIWSTLTQLGDRFTCVLLRYVDFRRTTEKIRPILPPDEEYYLRQNLILSLQQAQMGLLRERPDVFSTSLADASAWLREYFDPDHPVTHAMQEVFGELQVLNVTYDLPDVSASVQEVRALSRSQAAQ